MNILFGTVQTASLFPGGAEIQLLKTKEYLEKMGHSVELFNPWKKYNPADYDIFHLFMANTRTYFLGKAAKEKGFKLVLSPVFIRRTSPILIKYEVKIMNKWPFRFFTNQNLFNDHLCGAELAHKADILLPNTYCEANYIMKCWGIPEHKIRIIPNGVDSRFALANSKIFYQKYGIDKFILGVGSLGGRKNYDLLMKAAIKLGKKVVLIGDICSDNQGRKIKNIAEKKNDVVLIINSIDHFDPLLASAYATCEVFVLPSDFETPGLSALEAGLAGVKIVITEKGGTREYFGDMVDYIKPRSEKSLENALINALNRGKTDDLKKHILQNFTWEKVIEKTILAYEYVVKKYDE